MPEGDDIIIKGGSVDLNYDESVYARDPKDPKSHKNETLKISRVVITGDITYDSDAYPEGLRCEIRVITK
jgi:hypothetical protein